MGGFFYASKSSQFDAGAALATSRAQFRASGFPHPVTLEYANYVIDYYPKIIDTTRNLVRFDDDGFILSAGTFLYEGLIGEPALRQFYGRPDFVAELSRARGHFVLIIRKNGRTLLLKDLAGSYEAFRACENRCITSSFLAASAAVPSRSIDTQAVYEYIFNGVSLGTNTPFSEVRRLDLYEWMSLDEPPAVSRRGADICPEASNLPLSDLIDRNLEGLKEYAKELASRFEGNIQVALSGGYDSRLLLALFRHAGVNPHLFVYGPEASPDVRLAKHIAHAEGIEIRHVDKGKLCRVTPENYPGIVEQNFFKEDALPWGGIFGNGAELIARLQRNQDGALHVNGGGGEIFRNFFYLLDRPISLREFVWIFYSQFDAQQCTQLFDVRRYEDSIIEKVSALFHTDGPSLSRREVECLYPYFRCRSWFGRENSVNSRWGHSVLPFFDYRTVEEALKIPVSYKHFGNFESAMIRRLDPRLSAYPSNYGHSFERDAPLRATLTSLMTYLRPPSIRRYAFRAKRMLARPRPRIQFFRAYYLDRIIDIKFPYMSNFFWIDRVTSEDQFTRICTLEYLFRRLPAAITMPEIARRQTNRNGI